MTDFAVSHLNFGCVVLYWNSLSVEVREIATRFVIKFNFLIIFQILFELLLLGSNGSHDSSIRNL